MKQGSGFNALAGVRGFGVSAVGQFGIVWLNRFNALAGVRGFGGRCCSTKDGSSISEGFNALAGVRGFGESLLNAETTPDALRFQCPGGRSGIRRVGFTGPTGRNRGFNALAGVRGFGEHAMSLSLTMNDWVSMPWREGWTGFEASYVQT